MVDTTYLVAVALVAAAVTWVLRALPFTVLALVRNSQILDYLTERIPVGLMAILTIYTLRHVDLMDRSSIVPSSLAVIATTLLHLWRANMLLSVAGGTVTYVVIVSCSAL